MMKLEVVLKNTGLINRHLIEGCETYCSSWTRLHDRKDCKRKETILRECVHRVIQRLQCQRNLQSDLRSAKWTGSTKAGRYKKRSNE